MGNNLVIAGHGRRKNGSFDSGATGGISKGEHRYMKENLFPEMKKYSSKITYFSDYNVYDYGNIVSLAKSYGMNVTEFHFDSFNGYYRGGHVIINKAYNPDNVDLELVKVIGSMVGKRLSFKGVSGLSGRSDLANVNRTRKANITYRLVELGNAKNRKDVDVLLNKTGEYAKKLVQVIEGKNISKPDSKPVSESKPSNDSLDRVVKDTLNGVYGNYPERERRINKDTNYTYEQVQNVINGSVKTKIKVGSYVKIKNSAKHYFTGEKIPSYVKNKKYKIIQVKSDRVLLDPIYSWVYIHSVE